jgi:hypothetical protein
MHSMNLLRAIITVKQGESRHIKYSTFMTLFKEYETAACENAVT